MNAKSYDGFRIDDPTDSNMSQMELILDTTESLAFLEIVLDEYFSKSSSECAIA